MAERAIEFGLFVNPSAESYRHALEIVRAAEQGGIDLIGIQDHPYQHRFLDTWLLIADLLARTERLRFFPDVANLPLRPPRMMAKQAASLDVISDGRFELGLGAGAFWEGIEAMGGRALSPKQSVDALEQAIVELREFWKGEGKFEGPRPAHEIGIWLGAYKPRMLRITGALADGWIPSQSYLPPEQVPEAMKRVDDAAGSEDRDPNMIRRVYNLIGDEQPSAEQIADFVTDLGFDSFILSPADKHEIEG